MLYTYLTYLDLKIFQRQGGCPSYSSQVIYGFPGTPVNQDASRHPSVPDTKPRQQRCSLGIFGRFGMTSLRLKPIDDG